MERPCSRPAPSLTPVPRDPSRVASTLLHPKHPCLGGCGTWGSSPVCPGLGVWLCQAWSPSRACQPAPLWVSGMLSVSDLAVPEVPQSICPRRCWVLRLCPGHDCRTRHLPGPWAGMCPLPTLESPCRGTTAHPKTPSPAATGLPGSIAGILGGKQSQTGQPELLAMSLRELHPPGSRGGQGRGGESRGSAPGGGGPDYRSRHARPRSAPARGAAFVIGGAAGAMYEGPAAASAPGAAPSGECSPPPGIPQCTETYRPLASPGAPRPGTPRTPGCTEPPALPVSRPLSGAHRVPAVIGCTVPPAPRGVPFSTGRTEPRHLQAPRTALPGEPRAVPSRSPPVPRECHRQQLPDPPAEFALSRPFSRRSAPPAAPLPLVGSNTRNTFPRFTAEAFAPRPGGISQSLGVSGRGPVAGLGSQGPGGPGGRFGRSSGWLGRGLGDGGWGLAALRGAQCLNQEVRVGAGRVFLLSGKRLTLLRIFLQGEGNGGLRPLGA